MATPKLVVFDLDYTLWPFWLDTHVDPPFKRRSDGQIYDRTGRVVEFYPEVPQVLSRLHREGYIIAIASRTPCTDDANVLCDLFNWDKYISYKEIYTGSKVNHFQKFHKMTGIPYEDMIFFDDEHRNIVEVGNLGVTSIFVGNGVSEAVVEDGFKTFKHNRGLQGLLHR